MTVYHVLIKDGNKRVMENMDLIFFSKLLASMLYEKLNFKVFFSGEFIDGIEIVTVTVGGKK